MTKKLLMLTCASGAVILGASAGHAATASAAATTDTADQSATSVTEIVVTAEKREQSLQRVPVAVSVFTGSQRDTIGINSVQDVTNFAPGFVYDPYTTHPYIRGVGRQSINETDDERVATYEDEFFVYTSYQLNQSSLFLTQEQIERGPQNVGGRNAAAGSIDMISVRPTDTPYAEVRANIGNFGTYNVEGAVSGQVAPGLDVRLAAYDHNQDQGYYNNLANGVSEGGRVHEWYVQGQVDWKPNDKAELWVKGFWSGWADNFGDAASRSGYVAGKWDETNLTDGNANPYGGSQFVNPDYGYQAFSAAAAAGRNPADPAVLSATLGAPGILNNPAANGPNNFADTGERESSLNNYRGVSGIFTYDVTPGIQLKYVTGIQGFDFDLNYAPQDADVTSFTVAGSTGGCPALAGFGLGGFNCPTAVALAHLGTLPAPSTLTLYPLINVNYGVRNYWWSHELSFQSIDDQPMQWTAGVYYFREHFSQPSEVTAPEQPQLSQPDSLPAFIAAGENPLVPGALTAAAPNPNRDLIYLNYIFDVQSVAGYGQLSYKFNDQFKLIGDLRYTDDQKNGLEQTRFLTYSSTVIDDLSPFFGAATPSFDETLLGTCPTGNANSCYAGALAPGVKSIGVVSPTTGIETRQLAGASSALTGGAELEWTPTHDIFIYGRYSRGYEDVSFNAGYSSASPEVKPEFINSYELGYKQTFGSKLLIDIAAFYYDYENIQLPITVVAPGTGTLETEFVNAPRAISAGVEFEAYWTPSRPWLITLSYSYDYTSLETKCSGTTTAGVFTAASGALCLIDSDDPDAVAPGANPAAGQGVGVTRYQGVNGNPLPDAPLHKLGLDVAYTWRFTPGSLTLSGAFIYRAGQDGTVFNRWYDNAPGWTDWDARLLWKSTGDKYEVIAYVKNIFNSQQYTVGDEGEGLLGTATSSTTAAAGLDQVNHFLLAPPRTFGMEFRYKFF